MARYRTPASGALIALVALVAACGSTPGGSIPGGGSPSASGGANAAPGAGASAAPAATVATTGAPAVAPSAGSLDPTKLDPTTGQIWGPNLPDACVLLPLDAVRTASGYASAVQDPTVMVDACNWVYPDKSGVTLTVARYRDGNHAVAALEANVGKPGYAGQVWKTLAGVGDSAYLDAPGGDAMAVAGSWLVFVGVGSSASSTTRGAAAAALLPVAIGNLPH
jgi:hypothetical protein